MLTSPYVDQPESSWPSITKRLVDEFPLSSEKIIAIVEIAWKDLFSFSFGDTKIQMGKDIFLPAQATGVIFERLISLHLSNNYPDWRSGNSKNDKDIINTKNPLFSFEIKTSSSKSGLYGNRSTGHRADSKGKFRTGYYLVINYKIPKEDDLNKKIWKIRFGWIDDEDWIGQAKPTGQQASIGAKLASLKLITIMNSG